jgi:hypothetical protein
VSAPASAHGTALPARSGIDCTQMLAGMMIDIA